MGNAPVCSMLMDLDFHMESGMFKVSGWFEGISLTAYEKSGLPEDGVC